MQEITWTRRSRLKGNSVSTESIPSTKFFTSETEGVAIPFRKFASIHDFNFRSRIIVIPNLVILGSDACRGIASTNKVLCRGIASTDKVLTCKVMALTSKDWEPDRSVGRDSRVARARLNDDCTTCRGIAPTSSDLILRRGMLVNRCKSLILIILRRIHLRTGEIPWGIKLLGWGVMLLHRRARELITAAGTANRARGVPNNPIISRIANHAQPGLSESMGEHSVDSRLELVG